MNIHLVIILLPLNPFLVFPLFPPRPCVPLSSVLNWHPLHATQWLFGFGVAFMISFLEATTRKEVESKHIFGLSLTMG